MNYQHHFLRPGEGFILTRPPRGAIKSQVGSDHRKRILGTLVRAQKLLGPPENCFGAELRCAYLLSENRFILSVLDASIDPSHDISSTRNMRQLFLRPASEPILLSFWEKFQSISPLEKGWINLAQLLTPLVPLRNGTISTTKNINDSYIVFPGPEDIHGWGSQLDEIKSSNLDPVTKALALHAVAVICHPFEDGNGRLARAAFWMGLSHAGISAPVIPLAPIMFQNHNWISSAHRRLSLTGDWGEYFSMMGEFSKVFEIAMEKLQSIQVG